ncbi:hypothetical protein AK830_g3566 [Neonectria ditissima]|uniref:Uncharacterized protein n=1 Tax=Neonectria ditissima TaxID=78410 RepID=A0A0P7BQ28_9HYPO|nr:hypothetical protein AK830_g3566 [Neonectria ditissima]
MSAKTPYLSTYTLSRSFGAGATRANEAGTRAKAHLERALSEIDGLINGLSYLDKTESAGHGESATSSPALDRKIADDLEQELDDLSTGTAQHLSQHTSTNGPDPRPQYRRRDWSSIRDVRDGMKLLWKEFDELAEELDMEVVNNIREYYGDAKGLRGTGGIAFRSTLTGTAPNDLRKIFALTSLSYVVSCLLRDRNRLAEEDVLAGIQIWMNAIQDQEERKAFTTLASRLWPEARNHLHFVHLEMSEESRRTAAALRRDPWVDMSNVSMSNGGPSPDLFPDQHIPFGNLMNSAVPSTEPYSYYPSPPLPFVSNLEPLQPASAHMSNNTSQQELEEDLYILTDLTRNSVHFGGFINCMEESPDIYGAFPTLPVASQEGLSALPPEIGPCLDDMNMMAPGTIAEMSEIRVSDKEPSSQERLQQTRLFQVFLIFLEDLDQLLRNLSGGGMTLKDLSLAFACVQEQQQVKDRINEEFILPLIEESHLKDAPSQGIVSVASRLVNLGYLQTMEKVEVYMLSIASVSIPWAQAYEELESNIGADMETTGCF